MMKRSFSLLLILTLILSSFSLVASAAGGVDQVMSDFNIMPQSCSADSENLVTRSEFAFTIANILGSGEQAPRETSYVDVPEDDENSGYIYFATVNGFLLPNGDMFCPNDPITLHDFNDAVVKLLAYETIAQSNGGGVDGAMKTVRDLKIYNGVTITTYDSVTVKQYRQLIYNLMTANIAVFNYNYTQEGNVILNKTSETKTILSQFFGISRYYGSITSVNHAKPSVKFLVTKNVTKANPENLTTGMTYDFLSNGKVDLNFYQNIPVEIWTNKDGVIVYIAPQANVEVFYDVIYSVNGKTNPDLALDLSAIPEGIVLASDLEEEYEIDSSIQIRYNGVVPSVPRKPLAGKYAKIVLINNKITFIETWELDEGGIVTEVNNSYVSFIKGEAETRLKRIGEYEDIIVVIDGRSTDRTQIKPGSLIHYYQPTPEQVEKEGAKDMLAIVVSEKTIAGSFDGMSSHNEVVAGKNVTIIDELEIGRNYYPVEKEKIYVSEDGETYEANAFDSVYDTQVLCYVDIYGDIRYVKALGELNEKNEFTGYIVSAAQSGFDDIQIKVQKIYPDIEEVVITKPSDLAASKYVAHDSATVTTLTTTFSDVDSIKKAALTLENVDSAANYLYKFTVNQNGVITQISEPDFFLLFGEKHYVPFTPTPAPVATAAPGQPSPTPAPSPTPIYIEIPRTPVKDALLDHFCGGEDERTIYFPITKDQTSGYFNGYNQNPTGLTAGTWTYFWIRDESFVILTTIDEELDVVQKSRSELVGLGTYPLSQAGKTDGKVKIAMLAEPGASQPAVWFLYGATNKMRGDKSTGKTAVIDSVTQKYDVEREKLYWEVVLNQGDTVWELDTNLIDHKNWTVTHQRGEGATPPDKLEPGMRVTYTDRALFEKNECYITGVEEFLQSADGEEMTIDQWLDVFGEGLLEGTLKKITDSRLFLENDGAAYHISNKIDLIGLKFKNGKVEEVDLSEADFEPGETIYYGGTLNITKIYKVITE